MRGDKPHGLSVVDGNTGHRPRKAAREPGRPLMDTKPPKRLKGVARATWIRIIEQLVKDQTANELSLDLVVAYCDAVADYERSRRTVDALSDKQTVVATTNGGQQQHPAISASNRSLDLVLKLAEILAIDPYARERRGRPSGAAEKGKQKSDDDAFLAGG